ncbi:MAG: phage tail tape measure protein [Synergistaceae bacterium]|nr:phage tail tape measure protein [Synergistaceae bacterium]
MAELSIGISLNGELQPSLSAAFKRAEGLMNELKDKSSHLSEAVTQIGKYQKLEGGLKADAAAMETLSARSLKLNSEFADTRANSASLRVQIAALKSEGSKTARMIASDLTKKLKAAEAAEKDLTERSAELAAKSKETSSRLNEKKTALDSLHNALSRAGVDTNNLASEQARLTKQSEQAASAQVKLAGAQARYKQARDNLKFSELSGDFMMAKTALTQTIKRPLTIAADYEKQMARVNAVVFGGVKDQYKNREQLAQLEALKNQAKDLGASTQFTSIEVGATQEVLARAGFKAQEIKDALPGLLDMAAAEGMDLASAADVMASSLRGFTLDASEAGRVADVLAKASVSTNTSIAELGEAMKYVAPVAAGLGVNIEDMAALLGSLANVGIKGSQGGTASRAILERVVKPPKEALDALAALKIPVLDKDGHMRKLPGLMQDLARATEKMGEGTRMAYLEAIFGKEPSAAALAWMNDAKTGKLQKSEQEMYAATGTASNMAAVMNDNLSGSQAILESSFEGLMNEVGGNLLEPVRYLMDRASEAIGGVTSFMQEHKTASQIVSAGVVGAGGWSAMKFGAKFLTNVKEFISAGRALSAANAAAQTAASASTALTTATGASAAAGTSASAVSAGAASTAGFSLMKLVPVVGGLITAVTASKWLVDNGAKSVGVTGVETGGWGDLVKSFGDQAKLLKQRNEFETQRNQQLAATLNPSVAAAMGIKIPEAAKPDAQATERIKEAEPVIAEIAEVKELAAQTQPVITESKTRIAEIKEFVSQVPPNMTELVNSMRNAENAVRELPERIAPYLERLQQSQPVIINTSMSGGDTAPKMPSSRFMSGGFAAHATGGIFSTPHFGLVAEAGTEAIIPLEDKSRGVPLWLAAGEQMGLELAGQANIANSRSYASTQNVNKPEYHFSITVNSTAEGGQTGRSESLELSIKRAIDAAMREAAEREAMVSFA